MKKPWKYYQCKTCGLVALHPRPTLAELLKSYHAYLPVAPREIDCWEEMIKPVIDYAVDLITSRKGKHNKRLLDIGCGYGFFLKRIEESGWEVEGIEVSGPGREYARNRLGLRIHAEPLEDISLPKDSFDAVTLFYVIEHVYDPFRLLQEVKRILKPGGILLLRWPHSTPIVKILGPFSRRYDVYHTPYHLYDFNPKNMKRLLELAGFESIETMIGGHTLPQRKLYRWSSSISGGLAETLLHLTAGKFLVPGVSKTTIAYKMSA
jgi:SAM-dependent methyltransferase